MLKLRRKDNIGLKYTGINHKEIKEFIFKHINESDIFEYKLNILNNIIELKYYDNFSDSENKVYIAEGNYVIYDDGFMVVSEEVLEKEYEILCEIETNGLKALKKVEEHFENMSKEDLQNLFDRESTSKTETSLVINLGNYNSKVLSNKTADEYENITKVYKCKIKEVLGYGKNIKIIIPNTVFSILPSFWESLFEGVVEKFEDFDNIEIIGEYSTPSLSEVKHRLYREGKITHRGRYYE